MQPDLSSIVDYSVFDSFIVRYVSTDFIKQFVILCAVCIFSVCRKGEINVGLYIRLLCRQCPIYAFSTVSRHAYTQGFDWLKMKIKIRHYKHAGLDLAWSVCLCKNGWTDRVAVWWSVPRVDPRSQPATIWVRINATWRIRLNDPCFATMRAVATITVTTCLTFNVIYCFIEIGLFITSGVYM